MDKIFEMVQLLVDLNEFIGVLKASVIISHALRTPTQPFMSIHNPVSKDAKAPV